MVQSFGLSNRGLVRTSNQDRVLIDDAHGLYLVADGVGGHSHGEAAAELAINSGQYFVHNTEEAIDASWPFGYDVSRSIIENRLLSAIQLANRQLCNLKATSPDHAGAGSTLVGVLVEGSRAAVGNVGDSRVYLLRGGDLRQLTIDDTWVGELVRSGAITEAQARQHSMRHVVTQAVGVETIDVHMREEQLEDRDVLLLTTDGIHGVVDHATLCSILTGCGGLEDGARRLIRAALDRGGPDNASCILVRYSQ